MFYEEILRLQLNFWRWFISIVIDLSLAIFIVGLCAEQRQRTRVDLQSTVSVVSGTPTRTERLRSNDQPSESRTAESNDEVRSKRNQSPTSSPIAREAARPAKISNRKPNETKIVREQNDRNPSSLESNSPLKSKPKSSVKSEPKSPMKSKPKSPMKSKPKSPMKSKPKSSMQRPGTKTAQSFHTTTTESQNRKVTSSVETKDDTDTTTTKITNEGDLLSDQTGQRARDLAATLCDVPSVDAKSSEKTQKDRKRSCSS